MHTNISFYSYPHDTHNTLVDEAYILLANEFFVEEHGLTSRPELARVLIDSDLDRAIELDPQIVTAVKTDKHSEKVCGALMFSHKPSTIARHPIHYLAISEAMRGEGLGTELLKKGELQMARNGLYRIVLHARSGTEDFYSKNGYSKFSNSKWDRRFIKNLSPINIKSM